MRKPFVATHTLAQDIPELKLVKGTPLRQTNPFGDKERFCYTQEEWERGCRQPWILSPQDLVPVPEWEQIRSKMIADITGKQ